MAPDSGKVDRSGAGPSRSDSGPTGAAQSAKSSVREAMLKPEFANKYAGIEAGVWSSAAGLAERLITRLLREGVSDEELPQRVLDPAHFDFRGGDGGVTRPASTR